MAWLILQHSTAPSGQARPLCSCPCLIFLAAPLVAQSLRAPTKVSDAIAAFLFVPTFDSIRSTLNPASHATTYVRACLFRCRNASFALRAVSFHQGVQLREPGFEKWLKAHAPITGPLDASASDIERAQEAFVSWPLLGEVEFDYVDTPEKARIENRRIVYLQYLS